MKSLKSVTIDRCPRGHHIFLSALDRCALSMESLTIAHWVHPNWIVDGQNSVFLSVHLPSLRYLRITMYPHKSLALFIPGLSLLPDVGIDLD